MAFNIPHGVSPAEAVSQLLPVYTTNPGFSAEFRTRLQRSIPPPPPPITPDNFVKSFEKYVTTNSGVINLLGKRTWIFEIPNDYKRSPVFLQCLEALKQALESTGFIAETNDYDSYMKSGKYAILTQLTHVCDFCCRREGCNIIYKATNCTDASATAFAICMENL